MITEASKYADNVPDPDEYRYSYELPFSAVTYTYNAIHLVTRHPISIGFLGYFQPMSVTCWVCFKFCVALLFGIIAMVALTMPIHSFKSGDVFNVLYLTFVNLFKSESNALAKTLKKTLNGSRLLIFFMSILCFSFNLIYNLDLRTFAIEPAFEQLPSTLHEINIKLMFAMYVMPPATLDRLSTGWNIYIHDANRKT